jgi:Tfp pilus assembly protein PilV
MTRAMKSEKGFSLIESMVAFGILALGMMAVGAMITSSMQYDRQSMGKRDAVEAAMKKIEEIKSDACDTDVTAVATKSADQGQYHLNWVYYTTEEDGTTALPAQTYRLVATVGWGGGTNCNSSTPQNCIYKTAVTSYIMLKVP